ncbi:MAG: hypothetical protein LBE20_00265 [Deltaproteobacteria bacterium]|jgi:hypothetical protein|nr:hypothetical protein [Deltaproteobacteria bacterium]
MTTVELEKQPKTNNTIFGFMKSLVDGAAKFVSAIVPSYVKQVVSHVCKSIDLVTRTLFCSPNLKNEDFKILELPTTLTSYTGGGSYSIAKQQEIKFEEIKQENQKKVDQAIGKISTSNLPPNIKQTFVNALAIKDALGYPASLLGERLVKMNSIDSEQILKEFASYL